MAIKFSQLPQISTISSTSLIPLVEIGISSNVLGVVTGTTLNTFVSATVSPSILSLQTQINSTNSNAANLTTSVNSLISGQAAASSQIGTLQSQVGALQTNTASLGGNVTTLFSSVAGANAAIVTANTSMKNYVDAADTAITNAWTANAASQQSQIALRATLASPTFTGTVVLPTVTAGGNIVPNANVTYNLGSAAGWWNTIYGKAVQAQYADLAEMYLADAEYPVGTVLMIGGEKEVTACQFGSRAIGPVSEFPSYLMNSELAGGTKVALKGRVPVKVVGTVKKGQNLIAGNNGCATVSVYHSTEVFAIALESSDDTGEKLIEALVL